MKKRKLKKKAVYISIVSFLLLIFLIFIIIFKDALLKKIETPFTLKKEEETTISMLIAGNVLLNSSIIQDGVVKDKEYNFDYLLKDIKVLNDTYNLKYYNQSSPIAGLTLGYSNGTKYNAPNSIGDTMMNLKFNLISLASQYSFDKGEKGINNTIDYMKTKNILNVGINNTKEDRDSIIIKETNNIKYTMLSYTMNTNNVLPIGKEYMVNIYNKEIVKKDVEKAKKAVDLIIVSINWKETSSSDITDEQKTVVKYLSDLGVDIVLGNNSFIQPITKIKKTFVIYSSGNLISGDLSNDKLTSMVTKLNINIIKNDNKIVEKKYSDIESSLLYTYSQNKTNYKVTPYLSLNETMFKGYKEYYNKYFGIITKESSEVSIEKVGD